MSLKNQHLSPNGFLLVQIADNKRWIIAKPPLREMDLEWIGNVGDHFKVYNQALMQCQKLNQIEGIFSPRLKARTRIRTTT